MTGLWHGLGRLATPAVVAVSLALVAIGLDLGFGGSL
jgi:hypothetical protein